MKEAKEEEGRKGGKKERRREGGRTDGRKERKEGRRK